MAYLDCKVLEEWMVITAKYFWEVKDGKDPAVIEAGLDYRKEEEKRL